MGMYIKGFHMPTSCGKCAFRKFISWGRLDDETGYVCLANENIEIAGPYTVRNPDCPLVPVPEPHGPLIDTDDLRDRFYEDYFRFDAEAIVDYIRANAPTVIPAEDGET